MQPRDRIFDTFIGVDLGGGRGKNTAVARLQKSTDGVNVVFVSTRTPGSRSFFDPELISYLQQYRENTLLAINAPLLPSVCMRCSLAACPDYPACQESVVAWFMTREKMRYGEGSRQKPMFTPYTQRACEVYLRERYGLQPREAMGQGMGPLTARAQFLRRRLTGDFVLNKNLLEVFPKATIQALFNAEEAKHYKREVNTWETRAKILEALSHELHFQVWREGCLKNDHCFDAVICAYTGYLWAKEGWQMPVQDREIFEEDGWIWVPPLPDNS